MVLIMEEKPPIEYERILNSFLELYEDKRGGKIVRKVCDKAYDFMLKIYGMGAAPGLFLNYKQIDGIMNKAEAFVKSNLYFWQETFKFVTDPQTYKMASHFLYNLYHNKHFTMFDVLPYQAQIEKIGKVFYHIDKGWKNIIYNFPIYMGLGLLVIGFALITTETLNGIVRGFISKKEIHIEDLKEREKEIIIGHILLGYERWASYEEGEWKKLKEEYDEIINRLGELIFKRENWKEEGELLRFLYIRETIKKERKVRKADKFFMNVYREIKDEIITQPKISS